MGSHVAGWVATISFGRPVLPPEVGALKDAAAAGGSGPDASDASGSKLAGTVFRPGASDGSTPTTSDGFASSMIALRSAVGSRDEIGCGVAPAFQVATTASKNSMPLGSPIVTNESRPTPRSRYARAKRFV